MKGENFELEIGQYESETGFESRYEEIAEKNFKLIRENAHAESGLFSAVDSKIDTPASKENHMSEAWIRDTSWNLISLLETARNIKEVNPENKTINDAWKFIGEDLKKVLVLLNQDRWLGKFKQDVIDNDSFTSLSGEPPEVHMKADGGECHWDQNQPESWGEMLIAFGKAKEDGIVEKYSGDEMEVIKAITEYLVKIKPWKFEGAGMWEGLPGRSPSSRSNAIAIAKGLDAILPLFQNDQFFQKNINETIDQTMNFVREDINTDYTTPSGHKDGADLAMLVSMILPETQRTALPFAKYVNDNGSKLGIGSLPGAIRFIGDDYKAGELGEARWFMADPVLATGYFREAKKEFADGNFEKAKDYEKMANSYLERALNISKRYCHDPELFPELFIQRDPNKVKGQPNVLEMNDGAKTVALEPLERSLIWNSALVMTAGTLSDSVAKLNVETSASRSAKAA